jgi:NAD+ kinase
MPVLRRVGLVVHPTRPVQGVLDEIDAWAAGHGIAVGQVAARGQTREIADPVDSAGCDLLLGVGGDGTALAALHAGAPASRPALGIACGSIGALTSVTAERVGWALDQIADGRWTPVAVPGLHIAWGEAEGEVAINDVVVVRDGLGQIVVSVSVDDVLYAELAGDGIIVASALGSTAYTMAAGGPILGPSAKGIVVTPLATHGGVAPPLVVGPDSALELSVESGYGGSRFELDGQVLAADATDVRIEMVPDYATMVRLDDEESMFAGLRRRRLLLDAPRILARDARRDSVSP